MITPEDLAKSGSEDGEQAAVFAWAALNRSTYPQLKWMHSIPNGGYRNKREAVKLVGTGLRSGILDIFLPYPTKTGIRYAGLYIEMKSIKVINKEHGGLTKEQLFFKAYADNVGYKTAVCYKWTEARDVIIEYLELK